MKRYALLLAAFLMLLAGTLTAGEIGGDWQGELKTGSQEMRLFLQIVKAENGGWRATLLNMDRGRDAFPVNSVMLQGSYVKLNIEAAQAMYQGKLSADGTAIDGTWTQDKPIPLRFVRAAGKGAWQHTIYVTVEENVTLEVIDWGGSGRPLVLLPGLGNTAHIFARFAPKLTPAYHVYGITRRGFGISSAPVSGYSSDRLGDDVLAVIAALKLDRPVLAGHSIAGAELSSVGSRHPEKVAGLIYLDAASSQGFYDPSEGDIKIDLAYLQRKLEKLRNSQPAEGKPLMQELLKADLPQFEKDLEKLLKFDLALEQFPPAVPRAATEIIWNLQKYTEVRAPVLAICAGGMHSPVQSCEHQGKLLARSAPAPKFIILPDATHDIFFSNEEDVLREINAFIAGLH